MSGGYQLAEDVSLAGRNTFRVPARAAVMADVTRAEALPELFDFAMLRDGPVMVLGEGSNLLFAGDFPGVIVCLAMHGARVLEDDGAHALVRADAGLGWNDLVHWTLGRGLCGLENMALIPGTVGASPIQNIGAYGVEVRQFIETVEAFHRGTGQFKRLSNADCGFGYRDSVFKADLESWVVTAVEFRLPRQRELQLDYAGVREELAAMGVDAPRAPHGPAPLPGVHPDCRARRVRPARSARDRSGTATIPPHPPQPAAHRHPAVSPRSPAHPWPAFRSRDRWCSQPGPRFPQYS